MRGRRQQVAAVTCMGLILLVEAYAPPRVADGGEGLGGQNDREVQYVEAPADYRVVWSPYHKIGIEEALVVDPATGQSVSTGYFFRLADIRFQRAIHLAPSHVKAHPLIYDQKRVAESDFNLPYRFGLPPPENVLVVGAGGGNDVAAALRAGAKRVVAVDIDPVFLELGRQLHPEKPYDDPRVEVVVDDARAFFRRCQERFDLIVFGHLSSQPRGHDLQLMSYFYTRKSFREARQLLNPKRGYLVSSINWATNATVRARVRQMLKETFGELPLLYENPSVPYYIGSFGFCYVAAEPPLLRELAARLPPDKEDAPHRVRVPTDDWPFLFLSRAQLPPMHICLLVGAALVSLLSLAVVRSQKGSLSFFSFFFFLGAGFMLLEVHSISRAGLLMGMTWAASAGVVSTIVLLSLAANLTAARFRLQSVLLPLVGLYICLALNLLIPADAFDALPDRLRVAASLGFMCLPVYFAGLVFVIRFATVPRRDLALGANLMGALAGGTMECLSFMYGMSGVSALVLVPYLLVGLTARSASIESGQP